MVGDVEELVSEGVGSRFSEVVDVGEVASELLVVETRQKCAHRRIDIDLECANRGQIGEVGFLDVVL